MNTKKQNPVIENLHHFFIKQKHEATLESREISYMEVINQYRNYNSMEDLDVMKFLFERFCSTIRNYRSLFMGGRHNEIMEILEVNEGCCPGSPVHTCCDCCNVPTIKQLISFNSIVNAIPGEDDFQERQEIIKAYKILFPQ